MHSSMNVVQEKEIANVLSFLGLILYVINRKIYDLLVTRRHESKQSK